MINYNEKNKTFTLDNNEITYIIRIDEKAHLNHLYFGKKICLADNVEELLYGHLEDKLFGGDRLLNTYVNKEYGSYGTGDYRSPAFIIKQENGSKISNFCYHSHKVYKGKKSLHPMPSSYVEDESEATTLEILLYDEVSETELRLFYTIFAKHNIIARHCEFTQKGNSPIYIEKAMSLQLDLADMEYEFITFSGSWGREKEIRSRKLNWGTQSVSSTKGVSSAEHNPSFILKREHCNEDSGVAYGFAFVYSGNFLCEVDVSTYDQSRINIGIHPQNFTWKLEKGETFTTPEAVMAYTYKGLNKMSQDFHKLFRERLCRGKFRDKARPILLNNWEATEMTFDEDKIMSIAKKAKEAGVELFVLDDGWFGKRNDEVHGLGDWFPNLEKLPSGISGLSRKVTDLGMKFGLWFEPEMANMASELYEKHPDYIFRTKDRHSHSFRYQYVLDFSRKEVVDYIYKQMHKVISESEISYIKWDMNRYFTEVYNIELEADRQGEVMHRYILGVYSLYDRLTKEFPEILFESCSSGGARFDAGILYYAPQTWSSDNTDANDRVEIQYSNSFFYPISSHGAHVSAVPNNQTNRITDIETRANISYFGAFGYELDLNEISEEEFEIVKKQIEFYKKNREVFQFGNYYRLLSPYENNNAGFMSVAKDGSKAFALFYERLAKPNRAPKRLKLRGLDKDSVYEVSILGISKIYYGSYLMNVGISTYISDIPKKSGDFNALLIEISKI